MADLSREDLHRLARLGAQARLVELKKEESTLRRAFPELFRAGSRPVSRRASAEAGPGEETAPGRRRRRRNNMSAAARKAVSIRMKKYWAERRKHGKAAK